MKKILSFAAALAIAGAQPCTAAFSAETSSADTQQHVQTSAFIIASVEAVSATNGMFTFRYDQTKLKPESAEFSDSFSNALTVVNSETPGEIKFAFASVKPLTIGSVSEESETENCFAKISLSVLNGHEENIYDLCSYSFDELVTTGSDGKDTEVNTDKIRLYEKGPVASFVIQNPVSDSDGQTSVSLSLIGNPGITNGILTVEYDSDCLEYTGFETAELFSKVYCEANETEQGVIKLAFASDMLISRTGDALKLNFKVSDSCTTAMRLTTNEIFNTLPDEYSVSFGKDYSDDYTVKITIPSPGKDPSVLIPSEKFDVTSDGAVTTSDLIELVHMITGEVPPTPSSDINSDGKSDSADLLELISFLKK